MLDVSLDVVKGLFFDKKAVTDALDRATARALSKMGAFIRRRAQTSIRYSQKVSDPGKPPAAHRTVMRTKVNKKTGVKKTQLSSPLRDNIFFAYEPSRQSVVIGPVVLSGRGGSMVLAALEHGGASEATDRKQPVRITVRVRPFMQPALDAEKDKLAGLLKDSVK